jgi:hypothetical protein
MRLFVKVSDPARIRFWRPIRRSSGLNRLLSRAFRRFYHHINGTFGPDIRIGRTAAAACALYIDVMAL